MRLKPNDIELAELENDLLEETIYDEVESYYDEDLVDLVQTADWD
jgi:hypothetical protein